MPLTSASGPVMVPHTQNVMSAAAAGTAVAANPAAKRAALNDLLIRRFLRLVVSRFIPLGTQWALCEARRKVPHVQLLGDCRQAPRFKDQKQDDQQAERHLAQGG